MVFLLAAVYKKVAQEETVNAIFVLFLRNESKGKPPSDYSWHIIRDMIGANTVKHYRHPRKKMQREAKLFRLSCRR